MKVCERVYYYVEAILGNDLTDTAQFESHLHSQVPAMNNHKLKAMVSDGNTMQQFKSEYRHHYQ